ncbi:MAG: DUF4434 domain-containing protein [Clostridia bacterium]|nr:DUF4434 domain-containing protein [Clostridia bacterium]
MFTFTKIISAVMAFIMMMLPLAGEETEQKCKPEFTGTFIQSWMTASWDDERWAEEAENMKEAGVEYLVLQSLADKGYKNDGGAWRVYYKTDVDALKDAEYMGDCLEPALKACQDAGIKVFAGLSMFDDFWNEAGLGTLYQEVCRVAGDMTEDIYNKYGEEYKETLYGWYFTPEISNGLLCQLSLGGIIKGINHLIDRINEVDASMPLLMSPFYSEYIAAGPVVTLCNYVRFFSKVNFRDGDIFAPQDAVGAKWTKEKSLEMTWKIYKAAVDTCDADVKLWANCENFDGAIATETLGGILSPKITEHKSNVTATFDRFARQMDVASKYAENIITFSYNHYYSPSHVNPAFINTYYDYLENGYVTETEAPQIPANMNKTQTENGVELSWDEAKDNMGIAYYRLEKDGEFLARIDKYYGTEENCFTDENGDINSVYTVEAVDAAGNSTGKITVN